MAKTEPKVENVADGYGRVFSVQLPKLLPKMLPPNASPDRFLRIAWMALQEVPALQGCRPTSYLQAVLQCAQLGLEIGGAKGLAYILPYKGKAKLIVGYKGLILLGRRAGLFDWQGRTVRERDAFDYAYGDNPYINHKPLRGSESARGEMTAAYSVAWLTETHKNFRVLEAEDVLRRREVSQSAGGEDSPWNKWAEEMWAKSAMRAHANQLVLDDVLAAALELEDRAAIDEKKYHPLLDFEVEGEAEEVADQRRADLKDRLQKRQQATLTEGPAQPITVPVGKGQPAVVLSVEDRQELERQKQMDREDAERAALDRKGY